MYVMFTSGSTGRPKGVLVEHRSALSLARAFIGRHAIGPADRVFGFFAPTFDPSVLDLVRARLNPRLTLTLSLALTLTLTLPLPLTLALILTLPLPLALTPSPNP